jgi:hypothetical protein
VSAKLITYSALFLTESHVLACPFCNTIDCVKIITNPCASYLHFVSFDFSHLLSEMEIYLRCELCHKYSILRIAQEKGNLVLTHTKEPGQS